VAAAALAVVVGVLATASVLGLATMPALGVAAIAAAWVVGAMTARMDAPVCYHCGLDLGDVVPGDHGLVCPSCGGITQPRKPPALAGGEDGPPAA